MRGGLSLNPSYYEALKRLTLEMAGVSLGDDHAFIIETRLSALARREGYNTLTDMIDALFSEGQTRLAVHVVSSLMERDTHFFDDPESLDTLVETTLTKLHPLYKGGMIRVLSFGCSSGQETVSIAIKADQIKSRFPQLNIEVVGLDYPSVALDRARAGRYTHFEVQRGLPIRDLVKYFHRVGEDWVINDDLRAMINYKDGNLLSKLDSIGQYNIVAFRNRFSIYSPAARVRVLRSLSDLVKPLGYLVLGKDETIGDLNFGFDAVEGASNVYRKREVIIEPEIDPDLKIPTDKTHFDGAKRRLRRYADAKAARISTDAPTPDVKTKSG